MKTTLDSARVSAVMDRLAVANHHFEERYPGESLERQPLHTVYGGAHLFKAETPAKLGKIGLKMMGAFAPNADAFASALGIPGDLAETVYERVQRKLEREPVEDFRIDFEDGFGIRPDDEEDETAVRAGAEVARGMKEGTLPPFLGIRIKPFTEDLKMRGVRTLDLFMTKLAEDAGAKLPDNFRITLPKITIPEQVTALVELFKSLEAGLGFEAGSLKVELMIEDAQAIVDEHGRATMRSLVEAAEGRCVGAHFGTYDYTASLNITADYQSMTHWSCDFAKDQMKVALSGTGIQLSDGATTVMPVTPHRGKDLTDAQQEDNREAVHRAWKLAYDNIMHSLEGGYYQGWDLHPGQLPIRYAAAYTFFLSGMEGASSRLKNFVDQKEQATLTGHMFDDAATGRGLVNFFLRALNSGAITEEEMNAAGIEKKHLKA
ncbi:MAG: DUF6986 family protein [Myxococcota bacterium]